MTRFQKLPYIVRGHLLDDVKCPVCGHGVGRKWLPSHFVKHEQSMGIVFPKDFFREILSIPLVCETKIHCPFCRKEIENGRLRSHLSQCSYAPSASGEGISPEHFPLESELRRIDELIQRNPLKRLRGLRTACILYKARGLMRAEENCIRRGRLVDSSPGWLLSNLRRRYPAVFASSAGKALEDEHSRNLEKAAAYRARRWRMYLGKRAGKRANGAPQQRKI